MKRTLVCILSLVLLLMFSTAASASSFQNESHDEALGLELFDKMVPQELQSAVDAQQPALDAYQKIMDSFKKNEFGMPVYPAGYAGEYIDESNQLVVLVTPEFSSETIKPMKNVVVKEVKHSYNDLTSMKIVADQLYEKGVQVISDSVDIRTNSYLITVEKKAFEKLKQDGTVDSLLKDSLRPIQITEGETVMAMDTLWGGDRIFNEYSGGGISIGIGGTYNGRNAIVTCGHGNEAAPWWNPQNPFIKNFVNRIGQVAYMQANQGSANTGVTAYGDFAIVPVDSLHTISNYVQPGLRITGIYSSLPVGTIIYKYGATTGYTSGTVVNAGMRLTYSGDYGLTTYTVSGIYSMYMSTDYSRGVGPGDSGGPVWRNSGSANQLHGIVSAGDPSGRYMYTTPIPYAEYWGFQTRTY